MIQYIVKQAFSFLTGGVGKFFETKRDIRIAELKAEDKKLSTIEVLELARLEADKKEAEQAKQIRIATKDFWEMRLAVGIVGISTSLHYGFTVIDHIYNFGWDIKPLPAPMDEWQQTIILSYFGYSATKTIAKTVATILMKK